MINALECPSSVTTQSVSVSEPPTHGQGKANSPTSMVCNLSEAKAFCENYFIPHVPILAAFGGDCLHVCRLAGSWDLDRMVSENANALFRSIHKLDCNQGDVSPEWDDLTFQLGPRSFLYADANRIVGFAATAAEAERLVTQFSTKYRKPIALSGGNYFLIEYDGETKCHEVSISPGMILSDESLSLHYGSGSLEWHRDFVEKLCVKDRGLSILEGSPGTGKTLLSSPSCGSAPEVASLLLHSQIESLVPLRLQLHKFLGEPTPPIC